MKSVNQTLPRLSILVGLGFWIAAAILFWPTPAHADGGSCGDQGITCGDTERCCEHEVAIFGDAGSSSPPYKEGKCIPKENRCSDFWCGNRHCQAGMFGTPQVCCVSQVNESQTGYRCAYNDLNCPGNVQQLHIRQGEVATTSLQH